MKSVTTSWKSMNKMAFDDIEDTSFTVDKETVYQV